VTVVVASSRDRADRGHQLLIRDVLQQKTARAAADRVEDDRGVVERGEDERWRQSVYRGQLTQHIDAALLRHPDVKQQHIDFRTRHALDRLRAILGFAGDDDLRIHLQQRADSLADEELIVGDEDADHEWLRAGRNAVSANPRPAPLSIVSSPPARSIRSRMPRNPKPSRMAVRPRPSSRARTSNVSPLRRTVIQRFSAPE
jgi:hypothetical protein